MPSNANRSVLELHSFVLPELIAAVSWLGYRTPSLSKFLIEIVVNHLRASTRYIYCQSSQPSQKNFVAAATPNDFGIMLTATDSRNGHPQNKPLPRIESQQAADVARLVEQVNQLQLELRRSQQAQGRIQTDYNAQPRTVVPFSTEFAHVKRAHADLQVQHTSSVYPTISPVPPNMQDIVGQFMAINDDIRTLGQTIAQSIVGQCNLKNMTTADMANAPAFGRLMAFLEVALREWFSYSLSTAFINVFHPSLQTNECTVLADTYQKVHKNGV
jgi:hypothetical protein